MNLNEEKQFIEELAKPKATAPAEEYKSYVIKVVVWARNPDEAYKLLDAGEWEDPEIEDTFEEGKISKRKQDLSCKNYRADTQTCMTGCMKPTLMVYRGGICPFINQTECPCYR